MSCPPPADGSLLWAVPMHDLYPVARLPQVLADFFRDHDAAVLAAGTAEADGEVAFPFLHVMRQKVDEQVGDAIDELPRLRKRANVFCDLWIASGQRAELGHKVRVGQEAHVKNQVRVFGYPVLETKADAGDQDVFVRRFLLKAPGQVGAQLVDVELGGVDDPVGDGADRPEAAALGAERGADGSVGAERMGSARLAVTADQGGLRGLKIDHHGG